MKRSILSTILPLFLSFQQSTTRAVAAVTQDSLYGRCDEDFCICVVNIPAGSEFSDWDCPPWAGFTGNPKISSPSCPPGAARSEASLYKGAGQVACLQWRSRDIEQLEYSGISGLICNEVDEEESLNTNTTSDVPRYFSAIYMRDGPGGKIVVDYNEDNPPPECLWLEELPSATEAPASASSANNASLFSAWTMMMVLGSVVIMWWL